MKELRGELEIHRLGHVGNAGEAEKAELKNRKQFHGWRLSFRICASEIVQLEMHNEVGEPLQPHPNLKALCLED